MPWVSKTRKLYQVLSSFSWTICVCYKGRIVESDQDMNANFVYEAINFRQLFASSLLQRAYANYADSPIMCAAKLTEYISNVDCNF